MIMAMMTMIRCLCPILVIMTTSGQITPILILGADHTVTTVGIVSVDANKYREPGTVCNDLIGPVLLPDLDHLTTNACCAC